MLFSDLLPQILGYMGPRTAPLGGPQPSTMPKSNVNVQGASIPSAHFPNPADFLNAVTGMQSAASQNALRGQEINQARLANSRAFDQANLARQAGGLAPLSPTDYGMPAGYRSPTFPGGGGPSTSGAAPAPASGMAAPGNQAAPGNAANVDPLDDYADRVIAAESGGQPNAKNPNSSASGPGQFTKDTWLALARKTYPQTAQMGDDALLGLRSDPDMSHQLVKSYAVDNGYHFQDQGIPVNAATLYLGHFLGPAGATAVLSADPATSVSKLLSPAAISANPFLRGKSAGELLPWAQDKMGVTGNAPQQLAQNTAAPLSATDATASPRDLYAGVDTGGNPPPTGSLPDLTTLTGGARQPIPGPGAGVIGSGYQGPAAGTAAASPQQLRAAGATAAAANAQNGPLPPAPSSQPGQPSAFAGPLPMVAGQPSATPPRSSAPSAAAGSGSGPAGMPSAQSAIANAVLKSYYGLQLTPVEQNLLSAALAGPDSMTRRLAEAAAAKAAGINPYLGGERPGVPIRQYNPQSGAYDIVAQNPRLPETGILNPNGSVSLAPGGSQAIGAAMGAKVGPEQAAIGAREQANELFRQRLQFGDLLPGGSPSLNQPLPQPALPTGQPIPGTSGAPNITQQVRAPGYPITDSLRTSIPSVLEQGPLPTGSVPLTEATKAWQAKQNEWTSSIAPAREAEQRLTTIANAFKAVESGSLTTDKAGVSALLKSVGINVSPEVLSDPTQVQLALHENYLETMKRLKASTSRFTQQEFRITEENSEHPNIQPGANLQMLGEDIGMLRQSQALAADWITAQRAGWRNPLAFESAWSQANPLSSTVGAVKSEIGPLKGMQPPGSAGAPNPASAPVTATGPGGHKLFLQDGQWIDSVTRKPVVTSPAAR